MNINNKNTSFADSLSTRSKYGLARCFGMYGRDIIHKPEVIAEAGMAKLERTVQLGKKSFQEIAEVLYEFGYIDDVERWLGS